MKARESGMPDEEMWDTFFNVDTILEGLGIFDLSGNIVDLGCGYGTFFLPAARKNKGTIHAVDIEKEMIQVVQKKASEAGSKSRRDPLELRPNNPKRSIIGYPTTTRAMPGMDQSGRF
jgi:SAM-dependent methyltransferase